MGSSLPYLDLGLLSCPRGSSPTFRVFLPWRSPWGLGKREKGPEFWVCRAATRVSFSGSLVVCLP